MKFLSFFTTLIVLFIAMLIAPPPRAAAAEIVAQKTINSATSGTITMTATEYANSRNALNNLTVVSLVYVTNSGGFAKQTIKGYSGAIVRVSCSTDATSQSTSYKAYLKDADGIDSFVGQGAALTATTKTFFPVVTNDANTSIPITVSGNLDFIITNAGAKKKGTARITFRH